MDFGGKIREIEMVRYPVSLRENRGEDMEDDIPGGGGPELGPEAGDFDASAMGSAARPRTASLESLRKITGDLGVAGDVDELPHIRARLEAVSDEVSRMPGVDSATLKKLTDNYLAASSFLGTDDTVFAHSTGEGLDDIAGGFDPDLDHDTQEKFLNAMVVAGLMKEIHRADIVMGGMGTLHSMRVEEGGGIVHESGDCSADPEATANLGLYTIERAEEAEDGVARQVLRFGKVITAEQAKAIAHSVEHGEGVADDIGVMVGRVNAMSYVRESEHIARERAAFDAANADPDAEIQTVHMVLTGNATAGTGLISGELFHGDRNKLAYQVKAMRALMRMAKHDGIDTSQFSAEYRAYQKVLLSGAEDSIVEAARQELLGKIDKHWPRGRGERPALREALRKALGKKPNLKALGGDIRGLSGRTAEALAIKDTIAALLTGVNSDGRSLERGAEISLNAHLDSMISMVTAAGCKSGQDRTLHIFAVTLANRALVQNHGAERATRFIQNFDEISRVYDRAQSPTWRDSFKDVLRMVTPEKRWRNLCEELRIAPDQMAHMIGEYRESYLQVAIEAGLPITEYSTLLTGMKWNSGMSENPFPKPYIPTSYRGRQLMVTVSKGYREFTDFGNKLLKGNSANRAL